MTRLPGKKTPQRALGDKVKAPLWARLRISRLREQEEQRLLELGQKRDQEIRELKQDYRSTSYLCDKIVELGRTIARLEYLLHKKNRKIQRLKKAAETQLRVTATWVQDSDHWVAAYQEKREEVALKAELLLTANQRIGELEQQLRAATWRRDVTSSLLTPATEKLLDEMEAHDRTGG